jgi:hypothetical protein
MFKLFTNKKLKKKEWDSYKKKLKKKKKKKNGSGPTFWWEHCNEFWPFGGKVITKTASFRPFGGKVVLLKRHRLGLCMNYSILST